MSSPVRARQARLTRQEERALAGRMSVSAAVDRNLALPWISLLAVYMLAVVVHGLLRMAPDVLPLVLILGTAATCGVGELANRLAHDRSAIGRRNLVANLLGGLGYVTISAWVPPWDQWSATTFWLLGPAAALVWNLRNAAHAAGGEAGDLMSRAWRDHVAPSVGLEGTTARAAEISEGSARLNLQLTPGETVEDVARRLPNIASAAKLPRGGARVIPDLDDSSRAELVLRRIDHLRKVTPWPGPVVEHVGMSIADAPIPLGLYEDGVEASLYLLERHVMVNGMTGAGKTQAAMVLLAGLLYRRDVALWVIDTVKGDQTFAELAPAVDWYATNAGEAGRMFDALVRMVAERAAFLGSIKRKRWTSDVWDNHAMPFLVVLIEEAAAVTGHSAFTKTVERARSVGISVVCSMQRASFRNINTDARAQFASALQFGVKDIADAFVLSDDLIERGADPSVWADKRRGYCFLETAEVGEDRDVLPLRTYLAGTAQLEAAAAWRVDHTVELDATSVEAAGEIYASRRSRGRLRLVTEDLPGDAIDMDADEPVDPDDEDQVDALAHRTMTDIDQLAQEGDVRGDQDLSGEVTTGLRFPDPPQKVSTEEARGLLARVIEQWAASGKRFGPADFYRASAEIGRSDSWVRREFRRLEREGVIECLETGVYRAVVQAQAL